MLKWKLYYGDGSTFSSDDGTPASAPSLNVQVVNEYTEKEGVNRLSGKDYYWWDDRIEMWCAGEIFGLFDWLITGGGGVKFGRSMGNKEFEQLFRSAVADPDFPTKSLRNYAREGPPRFDETP